jgi:hypothetical protein
MRRLMAPYLTNSCIARSNPSSVNGYMRPPMSWRIRRFDWLCSQSRSATYVAENAIELVEVAPVLHQPRPQGAPCRHTYHLQIAAGLG